MPAFNSEHTITIEAGNCQGTIYDRNMRPIVNGDMQNIAVAVPSALDRETAAGYALDRESFLEDFDRGEPFVFECSERTIEGDGLTVFSVPVRYSEHQKARHIIGYLSEGRGADGIEYAYDSILRAELPQNSVTYSTDGFGNVLIGDGKKIFRSESYKSGVVLTIDRDIQQICEECGKDIETGAIVCADIKTAYRCSRMKKQRSFIETAICGSDDLDRDSLVRASLGGTEGLLGYLESTSYGDAAKLLAESPAKFEKWCDDVIMERTFENIPIIRNQVTLYTGSFFGSGGTGDTGSGTFRLTADPDWDSVNGYTF